MIYDAHVHIGEDQNFIRNVKNELFGYQHAQPNPWKKFQKVAFNNDIFKALVFPFPFKEIGVTNLNNYIISVSDRDPLFIPLLLLDTDITFLDKHVSRIAGVKEHFYMHRDIDITNLLKIYDYLQSNDLVLLIHPHKNECLERMKLITKNFPRLKIILAHSGRRVPYTSDGVLEEILPVLKAKENIYFDTSSIRQPKVIKDLINSIGNHRILFGSDYPYYQQAGENVYHCELKMIDHAHIDEESRDKITTKNFRNLFLKREWLRRVSREDGKQIESIIHSIPEQERRFLALDKKVSLIKSAIKQQRHIYLLENNEEIIGFLRESGRPNNAAVIEEIYVIDKYRGKGYGVRMIDCVARMFNKLEAKVFASNQNMIKLMEKCRFDLISKSSSGKILIWQRLG